MVIDRGGKNTKLKNSVEIYTDGTLAYSSPVLESGGLPVDVRINIGNCNLLTIMFKEGVGAASLIDPVLYNERGEIKANFILHTNGITLLVS